MKQSAFFDFFFVKTIFNSLLVIFLVGAGLISYQSMIKESAPDLEIPMALVVTTWPGAPSDLVEKRVTIPIEKKIKSLSNLKRYRSGSVNSASYIAVEFQADANMDKSMRDLREKVAEAESSFPKEVKRPLVETIRVTDFPIVTFVMFGDISESTISVTAEKLKNLLLKIPGIKKATLDGNRGEIVEINLNPAYLADLNLSPHEIKETISGHNDDLPWGRFEQEGFKADLKMEGRFQNLEDLRKLPITKLENGRIVYLREIATIGKGLAAEKVQASMSKHGSPYQKVVSISLYKLPAKDTIRLIEKAKTTLASFSKTADWPASLSYDVILDESLLIKENLSTVFINGWQAVLAVFLVLLFMLSWREAFVAGICIPITFMGAILVLRLLNYTINELVIIGMVLALGLLVDAFILMMEGMHDAYFVKGLSPVAAIGNTLKTYALPAFSGTATTIIVFVPLMSIGGIDGKFLRLIPVTATICLVIAYIVAILVAIPFISIVLGKSKSVQSLSKIDQITEQVGAKLNDWLLRFSVRNKKIALLWAVGTVAIFIMALTGASMLPSELYPKDDGRKLGITIELDPDTSLEDSKKYALKIGELLQSQPHFESVIKYVGMKSPLTGASIGDMLSETVAPSFIGFSCVLIPKEERELLGFEVADQIRVDLKTLLHKIPGASLIVASESGGSSSEDPIQIEIMGNNMTTLRQLSFEVRQELSKLKGAVEVRDNLGNSKLEMKMIPNREALSFYNVDPVDLSLQMRILMKGVEVGKFKQIHAEEDLEIHLRALWPGRKDLKPGNIGKWEELQSIRIVNTQGERVPLMALVDTMIDQSPMSIIHKNGKKSITVLSKTKNRTAEEILRQFEPRLKDLQKNWPAGYTYHFAGEAEQTSENYSNTLKTFGIGVFLVFAILSLLFGSYRQPFIIMFTLLFGLIGTFGGFFLAWIPISFPAMVGIISLIGIVVNDAIVMIETMNNYRRQGMPVKQAASRGAADRLRPILSTTLTTLIGLIPLALSKAMWMPLCSAIIFGLIASTVLSLLVIPCLYILLTPEEGRQAEEVCEKPALTGIS